MFGHPAAAMQMRMGNLKQACVVYRKLLAKHPDDELGRTMLEHTEAVMRAVRGEPVVDDYQAFDETTNQDGEPLFDLNIPPTAVTGTPVLERSGRTPVRLPLPEGVEEDDPVEQAEHYLAEGRLEEAEAIYRQLAQDDPDNPEWLQRSEAVRAAREGETNGVVLVRVIRTVE
jgi:tetratricopeptide (TPR) repeat protein